MASSGLTEDLVFEILSWLPVKSLLRFRCVCKSWCTQFEKPSFVSKHKSNNNIKTTKILVQRPFRDNNDFLLLSNETLEVSEHLDLEFLREDACRRNPRILGSCYGVICLRDFTRNDIILWNPSIRQSKVVPKSPIPHPPYSMMDVTVLEFGYGYDVKTNDFKVVRFVTFAYPLRNWDEEQRTEVYSLSTDSWRIIDVVPPGFLCSNNCRWTFVNGVLSNMADASKLKFEAKDNLVLISFDMRDEVFLLTPMPDLSSATHEDDYERCITVLNESIALFQFPRGVKEECYHEIWVLNEYGSKGSWTKLYKIGPLRELIYPFGFWKNSRLFMQTVKGKGGLFLCDLITQEIKKQFDEELRVLGLFAYKESLVSIKGGKHLLKRKRG